jgi:polyisoprenoid-binding protein YceI
MLLCLLANAEESIKVDNTDSTLSFSGEHAGMAFNGVFEQWAATLVLPPSASPKIEATFDLRSAKTGDSTYDSTLPEGDWFDVENHPTGKFVSSTVESEGENYKVSGKLTLRGVTHPVSFTLIQRGDKLVSTFDIDRLKYKIGLDSDPEAEWVSRMIGMKMSLALN